MVALSTLIGGSGSTSATDSPSYSWGLPKFSKGLNFTSECNSTVECVCCKAVCAVSVGLSTCGATLGFLQMYPLGDDCFVTTAFGCGAVYGKVYAIGTDGTISPQGDWRCIDDWIYECHQTNSGCACYSSNNMCCAVNFATMWMTTDAAGRLYTSRVHGCMDQVYPDKLYTCRHIKQLCWDSAACTWICECRYTNGNANSPYSVLDHHATTTSNPMKGVALLKQCWCNCNNRNRFYAFICGVRRTVSPLCNGTCCQDSSECATSFYYRTGTCTFLQQPDSRSCTARGHFWTVDFSTCNLSCGPNLGTYRWSYACCAQCGPVPMAGLNPTSGTSISMIATFFTCCCAGSYILCNKYISTSNLTWEEVIGNTCGAAIGGCVCDKSQGFCSYMCANYQLFGSNCVHTLKNGYLTGYDGGGMVDVQPIRGDVDYAPFSIAVSGINLKCGIPSLSECTKDVILVGDKWVVQLCCAGAAVCCQWCLKHTVYGYSSEC